MTDATLPHMLRRVQRDHPDLEAVVGPDGRLTYGELGARVSSLAEELRERGIVPGDRVGILMSNGWRWVATALAVHTTGASVVALNTFHRHADLNYAAQVSHMKGIVAEHAILNRDLRGDLERVELMHSDPVGLLYWDDADLTGELSTSEDHIAAVTEGEAYLLFTSGSTAYPKAVPLMHQGLVQNGYAMAEPQRLNVGERIWFASPLFFSFGCANALPVALASSSTLCLQAKFDARLALQFMEAEQCTVYYGLAMATRAIAEVDGWQEYDLSRLRTGVTGYSPEDKRMAIEELGITEVCSVYGLTEGYGLTAMTTAGDSLDVVMNTQGRAVRGQEIRIVGHDGSPLPAGSHGGIQIRGCLTPGYLHQTAEDVERSRPDGWFPTGDIGWMDESGRLHFEARASEMLKVKGVNVAPVEIEAVLVSHPAVSQAYVVGIDDASAGQLICAVVVVETDADEAEPDGQAIRSWLKERVASYKVPSKILLRGTSELPLTNTGKVSRRHLADLFAQDSEVIAR